MQCYHTWLLAFEIVSAAGDGGGGVAAWILGLRLPAFPTSCSSSSMGRAADCPLCSSFWKVARVCSAALCTASLACRPTQ